MGVAEAIDTTSIAGASDQATPLSGLRHASTAANTDQARASTLLSRRRAQLYRSAQRKRNERCNPIDGTRFQGENTADKANSHSVTTGESHRVGSARHHSSHALGTNRHPASPLKQVQKRSHKRGIPSDYLRSEELQTTQNQRHRQGCSPTRRDGPKWGRCSPLTSASSTRRAYVHVQTDED